MCMYQKINNTTYNFFSLCFFFYFIFYILLCNKVQNVEQGGGRQVRALHAHDGLDNEYFATRRTCDGTSNSSILSHKFLKLSE